MNKMIVYLFTFLSLFLTACASTTEVKNGQPNTSKQIECAAPDAQKIITYCASPAAADLAIFNVEVNTASHYEEAFSPLPIRNSPVLGDPKALVTVVFFGDLECSYCKRAYEQLAETARKNKINIVFKHTPLQIHPLAIPASLGAIAAGEQDKFWEFLTEAFEKQEDLSLPMLTEIAKSLKLDVGKWKADFGNEKAISILENDIVLSRSIGVTATPTLFINGIRVVGLLPKSEFNKIIDEQKKQATKLLEAGVKREDIYWRMLSLNYQKPEIAIEDEPEEEILVKDVPIENSPVMGSSSDTTLVTIVEFSDFQCPSCQAATLWTRQFIEENSADTRLVFHHFPLPFHEDADGAAVASIVAHRRGKFWEYHDILYANSSALGYRDLEKYAKRVGINKSKFRRAFKDPKLTDYLSTEVELAHRLGVKGTPTYYVNGIMIFGLPNDGSFEGLIKTQRELAKKIAKEKGIKGEALYKALIEHNTHFYAQESNPTK